MQNPLRSWLQNSISKCGKLQREIAEEAGISDSYVTIIKRNEHLRAAPAKDKIVRLALAMGVDPKTALGLLGVKANEIPKIVAAVKQSGSWPPGKARRQFTTGQTVPPITSKLFPPFSERTFEAWRHLIIPREDRATAP